MRLKSPLVGLVVAALSVGVATVPTAANAVPTPSGEFASVTPTVLRTVDSDGCADMVSIKAAVDLQGVGNAIAAQGYYSYDENPVYTNLVWDWTARISGPDNYYETFTNGYNVFPTSEDAEIDYICADDFGTGTMAAGEYRVDWTVTIHNDSYSVSSLCSEAEGCQDYPKLWERSSTSTFTLGYSAACVTARAQAADLAPKVKAAKLALKRAKASHKRTKVLRAKKKLRKLKTQLATVRSHVAETC